ncbi:hypothetical protein [Streptomonospora wellingtoniae]|uniref:Uncharacterized protein n=1 Tax=Streptomonospora wellingtoniae TaxID=3075544 RepID=A0ABU2KQ03_9ACTN|nr:hypothetical protein [Streptomonospora sp. DSM 45055]MDT0301354.1 hypothetical protein [Streptomonospora sp. DSM 45055]
MRVARERGLAAVAGSLEELPEGLGAFDTIPMPGNNLGLLGAPGCAPDLLGRLARIARPGARLIGAGTDPRSDHPDHRAYQDANRRCGRPPGCCASASATERWPPRGSTSCSSRPPTSAH